jgi:hypothetical protein
MCCLNRRTMVLRPSHAKHIYKFPLSLILICRRRRRCHCLRSVKRNIDKRFYSSMINDNPDRRRRRHMRIRLYYNSFLVWIMHNAYHKNKYINKTLTKPTASRRSEKNLGTEVETKLTWEVIWPTEASVNAGLSWRLVFCKLFCFSVAVTKFLANMVTKFSFHLYSPSELTLCRASC